MKVYVARQPIFDKQMNTYGYELLYRRGEANRFEHTDDSVATADVIHNAYLVFNFNELVDNTKAFINFSQPLIENEVPALLPNKTLVIEVLERVEPTPKVIAALERLKQKGYTIALDDFVFQEKFRPLIGLADIIKIDYQETPIDVQRKLVAALGKQITFLAEKVETQEEYEQACELGYDLFQGYFFSRPKIVQGTEVRPLQQTLIDVLRELDKSEADFRRVAGLVERSVDLSYKIIRAVNTVYQRGVYKISSIEQAVARLGINEMRRWAYLMLLREIQTAESKELLKQSTVRGKMMELMAERIPIQVSPFDAFITGLFSSLDILLGDEMEALVADLPVDDDVKGALLGEDNVLHQLLGQVKQYEQLQLEVDVETHDLSEYYIEAIRWTTAYHKA